MSVVVSLPISQEDVNKKKKRPHTPKSHEISTSSSTNLSLSSRVIVHAKRIVKDSSISSSSSSSSSSSNLVSKTETISVTWGDCAENHHGMKMTGTPIEHGMTVEELDAIDFHSKEVYNLCDLLPDDHVDRNKNHAKLVVLRNGVSHIMKLKQGDEKEKKEAKDDKL